MYTLIMYYRVAGDFLTPVIACLEHENTDLSKTALSQVAELALLMSDGEIHIQPPLVSVSLYTMYSMYY